VAERPRQLALWLALVLLLAVLGYASRAESGKPSPQVLYEWSTAIGGFVQDAVLLLLVLLIARFDRDLLALRRPASPLRAVGLVVVAIVAVYVFEGIYTALVDPGNEQGLTPDRWEPHHAAAYVVNGVVICLWVPLVEELTYRGLGFSLLAARYGTWPAIAAIGLLFGLAHGLLESLPVLVAFGAALAWIRARTASVFPGMAVHSLFNLIALVWAVTARG
jgi:uncharacterized protein